MLLFKVKLFSVLRSKLNKNTVDLQIPDEMTAGEFLDMACEHYPVMAPYRSVMRLAANHEYIPDSTIIHEGDEIAIITPVSGG